MTNWDILGRKKNNFSRQAATWSFSLKNLKTCYFWSIYKHQLTWNKYKPYTHNGFFPTWVERIKNK